MGGVDACGALWIGFGTDAEERFDNFFPVCSVSVRVENAQVKLQMRLVIGGKRCAIRWLVQKVFFGHGIPRR